MKKIIEKLLKYNKKAGFSVIISTVVILSVGLVIASIITLIVVNNLKISRDYAFSTRSYYSSEGGIEDSLIRLKNSLPYNDVYTLDVGNGSVDISIENDPLYPDQKIITAEANIVDRIRKVITTVRAGTEGVSFNYAIQSGDGGFELKNGATVEGNVYTNGNVDGQNNINSVITGDAWAVGDMDTVKVSGDAHAQGFNNCNIVNDAYFEDNNISSTYVGGTSFPNSDPVPPEDFPDINLDIWRSAATSGGTIIGDYSVSGNESLGPKKIVGNLTIDINSTLNMSGPLYITGNLYTKNNSLIKLDSSFGTSGSVILTDGKINISNNADTQGSGEPGSYILGISLDNSQDLGNPAIDLSNNSTGAVFLAINGILKVNNNMSVRALTGYKIIVENNATVIYDTGLASAVFTSGPSGGWEILKWKEIE